jgi:hypothetical protein
MNTEYLINIRSGGRSLGTVELPPSANEQQAVAIARKFARRFRGPGGYRFVVEPSQEQSGGTNNPTGSQA